jgi:hypothetical protein
MFDEETARAWMREARELARDRCSGRVLADELAERAALAFGVAGEGGPLADPEHWLHRVARDVAERASDAPRAPTMRPELLVIRVRNHGRTYWMIANGRHCTRTYAPHVSQQDAITRFEDELGVKHERVTVHRDHRPPEGAAALVARTFGGN